MKLDEIYTKVLYGIVVTLCLFILFIYIFSALNYAI